MIDTIISYYEKQLIENGDNHLGVGWPNAEDAARRYEVMLDIVRQDGGSECQASQLSCTLLDFGCGLAALYQHMLKYKHSMSYSGLDISDKFVKAASKKFPKIDFMQCDILQHQLLKNFDYVIANGVLTVKRELSFADMWEYTQKLLPKMFSMARRGLAVNFMSKQVDWERPDLFHLPLDMLAEFLTAELSRNFIIRHDYQLYEYTVYVYK